MDFMHKVYARFSRINFRSIDVYLQSEDLERQLQVLNVEKYKGISTHL